MINVPPKLKRHIFNFVRFILLLGLAEFTLQIVHRFGGLEHYGLIEFGLWGAGILITGWFVWRLYTGVYRDGDFYDEW